MYSNATGNTVNRDGVIFTGGSRQAVESHAIEIEQQRVEREQSTLFSTEYFNSLMTRFFMTYTADNGRSYLYKDLLLNLMDHDDTSFEQSTIQDENIMLPGSMISCFTLELGHLTKHRQWDVEGTVHETTHLSDMMSECSLRTDQPIPRQINDCDLLYQCFRKQPLRYIPLAEAVIKNCYKILTNRRLNLFQLELADGAIPSRNIRQLNATSDMDQLVLVPGIVVATNRPMLKGAHLTARCKGCGHVTSLKMPLWKEGGALPKRCEKPVVQHAAGSLNHGSEDKCPPNPYEILSEFTTFVEIQTVKLQERPEDIPVGDIPRAITVSLSGVHTKNLRPGMRKYILGVFTNSSPGLSRGEANDRDTRSSMMHCLGIFKDTEEVHGQEDDHAFNSNYTEFSLQEINSFKQFSQRPDLLTVITNSIAPSICGHDDVKRSIACMLFGGTDKSASSGNRNRADIHILLLGDPSVAKSQFLKFACKVAQRGVYTSGKGSSAAGLTAAIVKDIQGNFALEGGAMVLADGGIVCIDEFDKMRDDDRVAIHEAMEQQTISIAKAGITTVLGTKCSVLSAANPSFGSFDISKDTSEQHDFETTILSRFDLIWLIKDEKDYNKDRKIASHIFNLFANADRESTRRQVEKKITKDSEGRDVMSTEYLKRYLKYARTCMAPRLTQAVATRLENYYIEVREACRLSTQRRVDQIPITVRQLESLVRISESLAKMHLCDTVQTEHVEEAIRLFNDATVASSQSAHVREALNDEEKQLVNQTEEAILRRVAINDRISKYTICKDLMNHGFQSNWIQYAINVLVKKGHLKETRDSNVIRVM